MKLFRVLHDGPSRPIIETPNGRWLSLNQFGHGQWGAYEREEEDAAVIVEALNWLLLNANELVKDFANEGDAHNNGRVN